MLGTSYCEIFMGMARGVLVMRWLGPVGRGVMRMVAMAHRYLTNSHLGILHGMSKELPLALGRGDTADADEIEAVGTAYVIGTSLLGALGMVVFGLAFAQLGADTRLSFMAGGGILLTVQAYALYRVILRAWGHFSLLASAAVVNSVGQFVLQLVGAKYFHTTGAMVGWLLGSALTIAYYRFGSRMTFPVRLDWKPALRLLKVGLPLSLIMFCDTLLRTVDGVVVVAKYSAYRFGVYSVAMQMATYLVNIAESVGFVIMPRILEAYGATGDAARLRREVLLPTIAVATVMPVAAGLAYIILPPMIVLVVPKFVGCIFATQTLCLASVLLALPIAANSLLIALNREFFIAFNKALGAGVIWVLAEILAGRQGSLSQIALICGIGYFISSLLSLVEVLGRYYDSKFKLGTQLALCYAPLAWCVGALWLSGHAVRAHVDPLMNTWGVVVARVAIFLVLMLPVLWYGNARTGLVHEFRRIGARLARQRGAKPKA